MNRINRIRIALCITIILASMYAASAFLVSRTDFAAGVIVVCVAAVGLDWCQRFEKRRLTVGRAQVWERRRIESGEW